MNRRSELSDVFQNGEIHAKWESAYRRQKLQNRFNDALMNRFLRWLQLPPGARVLDAGCGTGEHACRLAQRGFHCVGVDLSESVLAKARARADELEVASRTQFVQGGLENLAASDNEFDAVHCRGVLMHIPRFRDALGELCRALKPGGRIVISESNHRSVETCLVRAIRLVRRGESEMVATEAGLEFHCRTEGEAPLTRIANIPNLLSELRERGVRPLARFATEFWDISRFPAGLPRRLAILFNWGWFSLHLPARLSTGNAVVGQKDARPHATSDPALRQQETAAG